MPQPAEITHFIFGQPLSTGDRLWSSFPTLRPMATITHDTLDWSGGDEDGAGVHNVIGTRVCPYTNSSYEKEQNPTSAASRMGPGPAQRSEICRSKKLRFMFTT